MKLRKFLMPFLVVLMGILVMPGFVGAETNAESESNYDPQIDLDLTEQYEIDMDMESAFNAFFPENTLSWGYPLPISGTTIIDLAQANSKISANATRAQGTGTTKGKKLTVVVSATNSTRNTSNGVINTGPKKIKVGKLTATSTSQVSTSRGKVNYQTLSIHTATHQGALYDAQTGNQRTYTK